ncbi:DUF4395 domain-containing protein [Desmospora activa]|uniref:Uncharacterized protein DUF4395 n=1 Tax=Desmospora activa DSM 45169 TaxID=1121389 RepID=A0A2T4ZB71_9BACL|nr:DUF4395 domain-containing protein [Desmospora activa]PTM59130.1 uncharacterized protein DUF4395 [Desmospora activa DSM 45169]
MQTGIPLPLVRSNQCFQILSVLLALVLNQVWILAIPLTVGIWSLVTGKNPLFLLLRPLLMKPSTDYPLEDPAQQRFNQSIAVGCLALSLLGFGLGWPVVGTIFAGMVAMAALIALLGFCVGCFIRFQYLKWKHNRNKTA